MNFASIKIAKVERGSNTISGSTYTAGGTTIDNYGKLELKGEVLKGDKIYITAITNNGLSATVVVKIN